jgi:hypothetical protein
MAEGRVIGDRSDSTVNNIKFEGKRAAIISLSESTQRKQLVAYSRHPDRLDKAVQVRLNDGFTVKVPSSIKDVENIDIVF